jgi:hypothetical protein
MARVPIVRRLDVRSCSVTAEVGEQAKRKTVPVICPAHNSPFREINSITELRGHFRRHLWRSNGETRIPTLPSPSRTAASRPVPERRLTDQVRFRPHRLLCCNPNLSAQSPAHARPKESQFYPGGRPRRNRSTRCSYMNPLRSLGRGTGHLVAAEASRR